MSLPPGSAAKRLPRRILLVGNYEPDEQQSMQRYSRWLLHALRAKGCTVVLIRPVPFVSRLARGPFRRPAVVKYLGYFDKFFFFPKQLKAAARSFDLVHICDHSNSMYVSATGGVPTVITCHDVLAIRSAQGEFPINRTGWSGRWLQSWILRGLRRAAHVICVSAKTAEDLQRLTGDPGKRNPDKNVRVIFNPLNWPYKPQPKMPEQLLQRLALRPDAPYFLHVGGNQWYKNRAAVLRIFRELAVKPEFAASKLVMAGKPLPANLAALLDESGLRDRVISVTGTTNDELEALYSHALALVFPSLEEGFGWPIAEAQACGCPVAVTGRPPMTEVAGDAAIFFDPADAAGAAEAICQGLAQRESLREAGFRNLARFSEDKIVSEYLAFYADIYNVEN